MANFSFQSEMAKRIVSDCENPAYVGAVLASAVGSGKSNMLIMAANLLIERNPKNRILFLAHAQQVLKSQFLQALSDPSSPAKPQFTFGGLNSGKQLEVSIPQEVNSNEIEATFTHLIVDEAHSWFSSNSVINKIVRDLRIKNLVLASGTVSLFNRYNKKNPNRPFAIHFVSGEEMQRRSIYSAVDLDLVRVQSYKDTKTVLEVGFAKAISVGDQIQNPIIVCEDTLQAREAFEFLKTKGFLPALATSKDDPDNVEIEAFKQNHKNALVLVNRGILGLNVNSADSMFFLKKTNNIEIILQALARMFRRHPDGRKKFFWMPATTQEWNQRVNLLHKVLSLNKLEVMKTYSG